MITSVGNVFCIGSKCSLAGSEESRQWSYELAILILVGDVGVRERN